MGRPQDNADRQAPAWIVSALVHACLVLLALFFVNAAPRGAADEAGRQVGVVLKQATPTGTLYEGPNDSDAAAADATRADATKTDARLDALPDTTASDPFADLLPQPLGIGPQQSWGGGRTASEMTGDRTARPGGGPIGETRVKVFGVEGKGRKFVYVFDRSASMVGPPLAAAKAELLASLDSLGPTNQFQIVFFNFKLLSPDLTGGQRRVAYADDRNRRLAGDFVNAVVADGGTNRPNALARALAIGPDVVFFLTDADNPMSTADLQDIARRNRRVGATICTIEFGIGPPHERSNFLVQLASTTGGQHGYVDTTKLGRSQ